MRKLNRVLLAKWLKDNDKTTAWVAVKLNCCPTLVQKLLRGEYKHQVKDDKIISICRITKLKLNDLFPDDLESKLK